MVSRKGLKFQFLGGAISLMQHPITNVPSLSAFRRRSRFGGAPPLCLTRALHTPTPTPFPPTRPSHLNFPPEYTLLCCSDFFFSPFLFCCLQRKKMVRLEGCVRLFRQKQAQNRFKNRQSQICILSYSTSEAKLKIQNNYLVLVCQKDFAVGLFSKCLPPLH